VKKGDHARVSEPAAQNRPSYTLSLSEGLTMLHTHMRNFTLTLYLVVSGSF